MNFFHEIDQTERNDSIFLTAIKSNIYIDISNNSDGSLPNNALMTQIILPREKLEFTRVHVGSSEDTSEYTTVWVKVTI